MASVPWSGGQLASDPFSGSARPCLGPLRGVVPSKRWWPVRCSGPLPPLPREKGHLPLPLRQPPPLLFPGHPSPSFPPCPLCQMFAFAPPLPQPLKWLRFDSSPTFCRRVWCAGCLPEVVYPEVVTPVDVCSANAAFIFRSKRRESLRRGEDATFTMRPTGAFPQIRTIDGSAVP